MKKITGFVGSARKKLTYDSTSRFMDNLQKFGDVECEIVMLSDHPLGVCRGCKTCFEKGEERCPLKDDRDLLIAKMTESHGVVFATPNYSFQVSAITKIFLDRLGFVCHRPRFFGKRFTCIVAQGIYGGRDIMKYLNFLANTWGFVTVKGSCHTSVEPISEKNEKKIEETLLAHGRRFHKALMEPELPAPTLFDLMAFRMSRTSVRNLLDERSRDFTYYREKGWFESDFYYPTPMGPLMKGSGRLFDAIANRKWKPAKG